MSSKCGRRIRQQRGVDEPRLWYNILFWSSTHRIATISSSAVGCREGTTPTDWVGGAVEIIPFIRTDAIVSSVSEIAKLCRGGTWLINSESG
jgi:hypothetical protein